MDFKRKQITGLILWGLSAFQLAVAQPYYTKGQDPKPANMAWSKVTNMSDEFNDNAIDAGKWQTEPVANGWVWLGRPPGLFDPSAVKEDDGNLQVTVSVLDAPTTINGNEFLYQGAIVRSIHPGEHGWYYEARIKANKTEMSSTFWLMSKNSDCQKKHELDIQECVGKTSALTDSWGRSFNKIFHSNAIHRTTSCVTQSVQRQGSVVTDVYNWERYFVYAAWWKSPNEVQFFLDGEYKYSINPSTSFDMPLWIQMAVETYSWNPVPNGGGNVASETEEGRTTKYDWVRVWKLTESPGVLDTDSNLVKNPGFENANFDFWNPLGAVEVVTNHQMTGLFAARIEGVGSLSQQVRVLPNEEYTLRVQVHTAQGLAANVIVQSAGGVSESESVSATSYEEKSITFSSTAEDTLIEITIQNANVGDTAYIDNVILTGAIPPSSLPANWMVERQMEGGIYPNPLRLDDDVTLQFTIQAGAEVFANTYNQTGQLLVSRNLGYYPTGFHEMRLPAGQLFNKNTGLCIVQLYAGSSTTLFKLVVQ